MEDQWLAAAEDARRRLHTVNPGGDVIAIDLRDEDKEYTPRENLIAHCLSHYTDGEGAQASCPHVSADSPSVMFGAVAWPGKVFCGDCFQLAWGVYSRLYNTFGQFTPCDNCHGKPVPGNVDGSSTGVVNFGPVMVTISLCADCTRTRLEGEGD